MQVALSQNGRLALCTLFLMFAANATSQAQGSQGSVPSQSTGAKIDETSSGALYDELARLDSLLFDAFFVKCDAEKTNSFFTDDLEFYHDLTGLKSGQTARDAFKFCPRDNGGTRVLVPGSLRVYPIKDYGAIQMGVHRFGQTEAKFVHLWRKKDGQWKITRVLSFDHRSKSP
jgi:hypothetical protein